MSRLFQDEGEPRQGSQKVCLATTAYDSPDAAYTFSIQRSRQALERAGIPTAYYLLTGNCHVDDARNRIVQEFLLSDCTDLVFLDADVSWRPPQLVRLCRHDADVVGGIYPYRRDDKSNEIPLRMKPGIVEPDERGLIEVGGVPTGFMRIRRHVLETLALRHESFWNKDDRRSKIPLLFERVYDPETEIRWGGDLEFCNRWRRLGGTIHADYEMRLGHTGKVTFESSLGATLRRRQGLTLRHVCDRIRANTATLDDIIEAREYVANPYSALEDVLWISVQMARKANGPIIETGSGLTTILMAAAAPDQTVWCLEHHGFYAAQLEQWAAEAGVTNIALCTVPIKDGWYDLSEDAEVIPDHFALGLNDGPPRTIGSRKGFFPAFGDCVDAIICDDADDESYRNFLTQWANDNARPYTFIEPRAFVMGEINSTTALSAA